MSSSRGALALPLSDRALDLKAINTILAGAQCREKGLKIIQYSAKLLAYLLARAIGDKAFWSKHCNSLAKSLSTARRFFKFFRWLKHFDDIGEAMQEKDRGFGRLLLLDVGCNLVADVGEDITSLDKLGIIRKGILPPRFEFYSNWTQLVLAVVEIFVARVKYQRAAADTGTTVMSQRKRAMAGLELSKFLADLGKAFWDCELSFASEFAFCICGLWAAIVSSHKYALKVLK